MSMRIVSGLAILNFAGQAAWALENQYYNLFFYERILTSPIWISVMVAVSAIVGPATGIGMGIVSDRLNHRQGRLPMMRLAYLAWAALIAIFPGVARLYPVTLAAGSAVLLDCLMTFCGSTAQNAGLNALATDLTAPQNRGRAMGWMELARWLAAITIFGGAGWVIHRFGYTVLFAGVGGLVLAAGLTGIGWLRGGAGDPANAQTFPADAANDHALFSWKASLRQQRDLWWLLLAMGFWSLATQVFFPYLTIYLQHTLGFSPGTVSLLMLMVIILGGMLPVYPLGWLADHWGRGKTAWLAVGVKCCGLLLFSLARSPAGLIISGAIWLAATSAWAITCNAWSKDLFPEAERGRFSGVVSLFNVAFAMIPGAVLGGWLVQQFGQPTTLAGQTGTLPTSLLFQVAALATLATALPLWKLGQTQRRSEIHSH
ncbi:MAG: MFS transporter [Chloroflexota bacterium]